MSTQLVMSLLEQSETNLQALAKQLYEEIQRHQELEAEFGAVNQDYLEVLYRIAYNENEGAVHLSSELAQQSEDIFHQIIEELINQDKVMKKALVNELLTFIITVVGMTVNVLTAGATIAVMKSASTVTGMATATTATETARTLSSFAGYLSATNSALSSIQAAYNGDSEGAVFHAGMAVMAFAHVGGLELSSSLQVDGVKNFLDVQRLAASTYYGYKATKSGDGLTAFLHFMNAALPIGGNNYSYLSQAALNINTGVQLAQEDKWLAATSSFVGAAYTLNQNVPKTSSTNSGHQSLSSQKVLNMISNIKSVINVAASVEPVINNSVDLTSKGEVKSTGAANKFVLNDKFKSKPETIGNNNNLSTKQLESYNNIFNSPQNIESEQASIISNNHSPKKVQAIGLNNNYNTLNYTPLTPLTPKIINPINNRLRISKYNYVDNKPSKGYQNVDALESNKKLGEKSNIFLVVESNNNTGEQFFVYIDDFVYSFSSAIMASTDDSSSSSASYGDEGFDLQIVVLPNFNVSFTPVNLLNEIVYSIVPTFSKLQLSYTLNSLVGNQDNNPYSIFPFLDSPHVTEATPKITPTVEENEPPMTEEVESDVNVSTSAQDGESPQLSLGNQDNNPDSIFPFVENQNPPLTEAGPQITSTVEENEPPIIEEVESDVNVSTSAQDGESPQLSSIDNEVIGLDNYGYTSNFLAEDDNLTGTGGNNRITGYLGDDELMRNDGEDVFIISGNEGVNSITDFASINFSDSLGDIIISSKGDEVAGSINFSGSLDDTILEKDKIGLSGNLNYGDLTVSDSLGW